MVTHSLLCSACGITVNMHDVLKTCTLSNSKIQSKVATDFSLVLIFILQVVALNNLNHKLMQSFLRNITRFLLLRTHHAGFPGKIMSA